MPSLHKSSLDMFVARCAECHLTVGSIVCFLVQFKWSAAFTENQHLADIVIQLSRDGIKPITN